MGAFFFLRVLLPQLTLPHLHGIVDKALSKEKRLPLIAASRVLMTAATEGWDMKVAVEQKEHMVAMGAHLPIIREKLKAVFDALLVTCKLVQ